MILTRIWWGLVELGFRLLYNELAWTYDLVSWVVSLGAWRAWQRSALRFLAVPPGSPVLELAHGTGNFQIDLRTAGLDPTGLTFRRRWDASRGASCGGTGCQRA